jgi:hypothetical protein
MSNKTTQVEHTGGSAYPITNLAVAATWHGLTERDYFAAAALTGLLGNGSEWDMTVATLAYQVADAMLKAREQ